MKVSAKARITIGLMCIQLSVLLTALVLGIVPERSAAVMEGRAKLCESIAVNGSVRISRNDIRRLDAILRAIVARNDDVLSAAVRRQGGELIVEVGEHRGYWKDMSSDRSMDTQVYVPIRASNQKWGGVEIRFRPVQGRGVIGFLLDPAIRLIVFVSALSLLVNYFYLGRILQYLDPSKAVPGRVRSALDTLAEGLMVVDKQGRVVLTNQAFARCIGKSNEQLLGSRASALPWVQADGDPGEIDYPWLRALRDNAPQEGVVLGLAIQEDETRTFIVNCSPVQGPDGAFRGVLISLEDVTQLEATKVELQHSKVVAEEANAAKSEFLARMSHEIRTPMNAILGFTDVLLRGYAENAAQRAEYLNTIHASGTHLLDLINDILDLSKIEAGRMDVERVRCSPYQLASQVVDVLRLRAEEKGIACELAAATGIPETILTDPVRFRQVLTNLVGNAIKFTSAGGVRVELSLLTSGANPQLAVAIVDSGIGIPPQSIETVFSPFSQADTTITRRFGGTGLGLPISLRLARALGGDITIESEPGEGSVFTATFDTGPHEGQLILKPQALARKIGSSADQGRETLRLPAARILVVDDGEANRRLITVVLRRAGVEVVTGDNGQAAIDLATRGDFDVILMDMQMPILDGYTAAATLRSQGFEKPIIALTADAMDGAEAKCRKAGCSGYLTKPIDMDLLVSTLREILGEVPEEALAGAPVSPSVAPCTIETDSNHKARSTDRGPLVSSLPTEDAEFCEIVVGWVARLREQLDAMQRAMGQEDYVELAKLAHWLKGSGETVGFAVFTAPAAQLERLAKVEQTDQIASTLDALADLADRIVVPERVAIGSGPVCEARGGK
ncbi:MAG: ATP-binding protein [Pirellulales bacterium]